MLVTQKLGEKKKMTYQKEQLKKIVKKEIEQTRIRASLVTGC